MIGAVMGSRWGRAKTARPLIVRKNVSNTHQRIAALA